MLMGHFIRILVETVLWRRRSSFRSRINHDTYGSFAILCALFDLVEEMNGGERLAGPRIPSYPRS